jgi:uncharacterized protein YifN (PemK superfamily)
MINQHKTLVVSNLTKACVVVTGESMVNINGVVNVFITAIYSESNHKTFTFDKVSVFLNCDLV